MKRSDAERAVQAEGKRLKKALGLDLWEIDISIGRCDGSLTLAEINVLDEYGSAAICLDHARHESIDELKRSLRHEFLHILMAPLARFQEIIAEANGEDFKPMPKLWAALEEQAITRLERTDIGHSSA